jgi:hypothetical protein
MNTKILLSLALTVLIASASYSQIQPGKILLGGSVSYNSSTPDDTHSFYSYLQAGKVFGSNNVFGIILSRNSNVYQSGSSVENKSRNTGGGVFFRKYKVLGKNFYAFAEANAIYQHGKIDQFYFPVSGQPLAVNTDGINLNFVPGISYGITKKFQVELAVLNLGNLSYQKIKTIDRSLPPSTPSQKRESFGAGINLNSNLLSNFGIGFKFFL